MDQSDLSTCTIALKVIDAFLNNQRGFKKTLGELKGLIILLREREPALSRLLLQKWSLLHELDAYLIYRRLPGLSLEQRALIDSVLTEMKSLVTEAMQSNVTDEKSVGRTTLDRRE